MNTTPPRAERRTSPLSRQLIVDAAIALLDSEGEAALTFRALTRQLATGNGAIYHHVANKAELLAGAAERVIGTILGDLPKTQESPAALIRAAALGLFDAIDAHPWLGAQLIREPRQPAMLEILEVLGGGLQAKGLPDDVLFDSTFALANYVLGAAVQNAANGSRGTDKLERSRSLSDTASHWCKLDAARYPFLRAAASGIAEHDDREQFLAGVDLILAGVAAAS